MERLICRSICLVCHQPFFTNHQSQKNTPGFRDTWNRMWKILVQHFNLDPTTWKDIFNFYDQEFEFPLCPNKCRKDLHHLLNLYDKLEKISQEIDGLKGNLTTTILNTSSSSSILLPLNNELNTMETETTPTQEHLDNSIIVCDNSIHEKINELRNHIANTLNPKMVLADVQNSRKSSRMGNNQNNTENVVCENSNTITTTPTIKQEFPNTNSSSTDSSSSSNIDNKIAKVVVKKEKETISSVNSDNMTVMENDYLLEDCHGNRNDMIDPLILMTDNEQRENDGKIKEEQMKEGIFSYERWSYVQLKGDDMFTCLKCEAQEKSQEEMIQHIQCQHEQTETEVSILGIPHDSDEKDLNTTQKKKKRGTPKSKTVNRQQLQVPKGKINLKSRWSCNFPGCRKVFRHNTTLMSHKKTHNAALYKCPLCKKTSRMKIELEDHLMLVHSENASLIPLEIHRNNLNPTSSTSTNDQPSKKRNLTGKIKENSNNPTEKPSYVCEICNKGFFTLYHFGRHNKAIHGGVIYKCPLCDFHKPRKQLIKIHLQKRHPNIDISLLSIDREPESKNSTHSDNYADDDNDVQQIDPDL